jgi:hypothetical protein
MKFDNIKLHSKLLLLSSKGIIGMIFGGVMSPTDLEQANKELNCSLKETKPKVQTAQWQKCNVQVCLTLRQAQLATVYFVPSAGDLRD